MFYSLLHWRIFYTFGWIIRLLCLFLYAKSCTHLRGVGSENWCIVYIFMCCKYRNVYVIRERSVLTSRKLSKLSVLNLYLYGTRSVSLKYNIVNKSSFFSLMHVGSTSILLGTITTRNELIEEKRCPAKPAPCCGRSILVFVDFAFCLVNSLLCLGL